MGMAVVYVCAGTPPSFSTNQPTEPKSRGFLQTTRCLRTALETLLASHFGCNQGHFLGLISLHGLKVSKHKIVSPRASASTPGSAKDGPTMGHFASHGQGQTTRGGLRVYKIVVLGDGGVGKSALTLQFVSHSFLDYHDPTIEDAYQQQAVIDGEAALLDILDTAGQVEFTAMRDQYMRCGEGFIICYSVTDRRSFQEAVEYRKLISRVRATDDIPLVLVGNKFDLTKQRKVTTEEGEALAKQLGCPFFETSAALRHFVDDSFHALVKEIRARERNQMGNGSAKVDKQSKWRRFRNIFSVVFRKKDSDGYQN